MESSIESGEQGWSSSFREHPELSIFIGSGDAVFQERVGGIGVFQAKTGRMTTIPPAWVAGAETICEGTYERIPR